MSLLDQARAPQTSGASSAPAAESGPAGISKGAAYQKKQKEARYQAALLIQGALKRGNVTLTSDEAKAIELLTKKPGSGSAHSFGKPIIYRLFGDVPKVGNKVTALEVFEKTGKGFQEIKQQIRKWAEKGTEVSYDTTSKTYTLTKIGALPAAGGEAEAEDSDED